MFLNSNELLFLSLSTVFKFSLIFFWKAFEFICLFVSEEKLNKALFKLLLELSCCIRFILLSGDISILFNK